MISVISLLAVFLGYLAWRVFTIRQLKLTSNDPFFSAHPEFFPTHTLGLLVFCVDIGEFGRYTKGLGQFPFNTRKA